jgi:predicted membrane protein
MGGSTRTLVLAALFAALGVLLSSFALPVGGARIFPLQHTINAVASPTDRKSTRLNSSHNR